MTEEQTFNALRRPPFNEIRALIQRGLMEGWLSGASPADMVVSRDATLKAHHWTVDEYIELYTDKEVKEADERRRHI